MDVPAVLDAVLVSIHPRYAEAILAGQKRTEFRKVRFKREVSKLLIYATAPISAVVAIVDISGLIEDSPAKIWERYASVGGIAEEDFFRYYDNCESAVAIEIANVVILGSGIKLHSLLPGTRPPQSFCYLPAHVLEAALRSSSALEKPTEHSKSRKMNPNDSIAAGLVSNACSTDTSRRGKRGQGPLPPSQRRD